MVSKSIRKKNKTSDNLIVIYTKARETADNFIEKVLNNMGRKCEVCVLTSDSLEQQLVFQRGGL